MPPPQNRSQRTQRYLRKNSRKGAEIAKDAKEENKPRRYTEWLSLTGQLHVEPSVRVSRRKRKSHESDSFLLALFLEERRLIVNFLELCYDMTHGE